MTPSELEEVLSDLCMSNSALARFVSCSEGSVRQWRKGISRIPNDVGEWLQKYHQFLKENPPPQRKKKRRD